MPTARPRTRQTKTAQNAQAAVNRAANSQKLAAIAAQGPPKGITPAPPPKGLPAPAPVPVAMAPTPPPPAPPAPPAVGPAPGTPGNPWATSPGDSAGTIAGIGQIKDGYDQYAAQAAAQKAELLRRYGVTEYMDPATGRKYRLDLENNPYSEGAKIALEIKNRRESNRTDFANGGMLFDGAYGAQMDVTNRAEGEAYEGLFNAVQDGVGGIEQGLTQAFQDAMEKILGLRTADTDRAASTITPGQGAPAPAVPLTAPQQAAQSSHQAEQKATSDKAKAAEHWAKQVKNGKYKWPDGKGYVHSRPYRGY